MGDLEVEELFDHALADESATAYRLGRALAAHYRGKAVVEGLSDTFDLDEYAAAGKCTARLANVPHAEIDTDWSRARGLATQSVNAIYEVTWNDRELVVATARWKEGYGSRDRNFVIADDVDLAQKFAAAVCAYCNEPHDTILTFSGSCWNKSADLFRAVQEASFDDLVLAGNMKTQIREDFASFLAARDEYTRYGVPWKRGVLFIGPPGNGKTHCLRATLKFLNVPILYVLSIRSRYETDDANIDRVFARARELTPCCLVFEDLDAMITDENRSYFLNQLDGFAQNSGVLAIATTNHPDRLDPAIIDRPSRFDRKYHFELPEHPERLAYIAQWSARLADEMRLSDVQIEELARASDRFSFAYLKELFLAGMTRWMHDKERGSMMRVLVAQIEVLKSQMTTGADAASAPKQSDGIEQLVDKVRKRLW